MLACLQCRALLALSMFAAPLSAAADPIYSATFLPPSFRAEGINHAGQVVGTAGGGAAIWSGPGALVSLGAQLPGSEGLAINAHGAIAGRYGDHAFVWADGVATPIATADRSWATGINDAGQVTGTAASADLGGPRTIFLYTGGTLSYFEPGFPASGESQAAAINNAGVIAGTRRSGGDWSDPDRNAVSYANGAWRNYGTLGGAISEAEDINDAGALAGWSTSSGESTELAFLFTPERGLTGLGSLGGTSSRAFGLNNLGWVVGMSDTSAAEGFDYHAFLYRDGAIADLNSLVTPLNGWRLVSALDINDGGQVLAEACRGGDCRAVRLDLIPAVPEASGRILLPLGLGLLGLAALRRGRRAVLPAVLLGTPLAALPPAAGAAEPHAFTATAIPAGFEARAINDRGEVVGTRAGVAAVWNGRTVTDFARAAPGASQGRAINNRGAVAGTWRQQPFLGTPAGVRDIGRFGRWLVGEAVAINDVGDVAGIGYWGVGERWRAWVFADGVLRVTGSFGGDWSEARAINRAGQMVGVAALVPQRSFFGDTRAFLYHDRLMLDLGALGDGISSRANDINDRGQVVGAAEYVYSPETMSDAHPFLYQDRIMRDLGTLGGSWGEARAINNAGAIVGESALREGSTTHAFLVEGGRMRDLHRLTRLAPGWTLTSAFDINIRRQILAWACREQQCVVVRLDPVVRAAAPAGQ